MDSFDDDIDKELPFYEEFKQVDAFYESFKKEFEKEVLAIIEDYTFDVYSTTFKEFLDQYAVAVLTLTHTVLDKDSSYPDYRKAEDLMALRGYYAKHTSEVEHTELAERLLQKTKELVVKYYPSIYDLTGDGFRLLEINLKLYNIEFVASINRTPTNSNQKRDHTH